MAHIPVLKNEVIEFLNPQPNENFIDCTIGEGGHGLEILERIAPKGKLLGIDYQLRVKPKDRLILAEDNFANLKEIAIRENFSKVNGIVFDLGMSSWHLESSKRGFSFQKNEPLDMRYDSRSQLTAEKIINFWSSAGLEKILREYGEEQFSKEISQGVLEARKSSSVKTTFQLVEIIKKAAPSWYRQRKINPATKTFQALRIAVNGELENLEKVLPQAIDVLSAGGRLTIISFHSLEDRIVKNFFRNNAKKGPLKIITKKPITPSDQEITINPRSRSAKLRAALKL
ncbi:MAG: 16S rRNA (cytosine(1402)-N(4))-methyltransferase RsmH [bacterium]